MIMETSTSTEEVVELEALLTSPIDLNSITSLSDAEIAQFRDSRGFTALMSASETGHIEAVRNLISRGEEVNDEVDGESSASLAFSRGHHEIVLILLKANSKFPKNYQQETASDELKAFVDLSTKMHENVKEENLEELQQLLRENFGLKYFYSVNNKSLLRTAIVYKKFEIYEFLLNSNIFLAPHESIDLLMEKISVRNRKKFSEINFKLSPELVTEPMMILLRNCKLGPDNDPNGDYMNFTHKAFDFLFKIPLIAIVLKVVAAYRNFSIVFDFNRDSVTFLDPQTEPYTNGLFHTSGKIFIAAKDMLDPSKASNTIAVIAHEFCHFAMLLVYGNLAMPYKDGKGEIFDAINKECEELKDQEEIVKLVYDCYDEDFHHAELIVRVPQMLALYANNEEILDEKRETFKSLFSYYQEVCAPEMEAELPNIENKFNPFIKAEKRIKKLRRWIGFLAFSIVCIIGGSIWLSVKLHNPTLSWSKLSKTDQMKVKDSSVEYYGTDVKFGELFANDSNVYELLSSEQIKGALNGDTNELSRALNLTLNHFVLLSWSNMTRKLQEKFLRCEVEFQGEKVSFGNIFNQTNSSLKVVFDNLSPKDVRKVLKEKFSISKRIKLKVKFYIERDFIAEQKVFGFPIKVSNLIAEMEERNIFLLSSVAGEGKSTTMRHLGIKMKEKYPSKWVQFVELKKHWETYKANANLNFSNIENICKFLSDDLFQLNGVELEVFKELFKANQVVFLWDGIDEISPVYLNFIMNLTSSIKNSSNIIQFLSTRPQYSKDFQESLYITSYKLIPLDEDEIREFCIKFIAFENFKVNGDAVYDFAMRYSNSSYNSVSKELSDTLQISLQTSSEIFLMINKSSTVLESITNDENELIENPLLVRMVTEIITDFDIHTNSGLNLYQFYTIFVHKKFDIFRGKEGNINREVSKLEATFTENIMRIHQAYTLKMGIMDNDEFDDDDEEEFKKGLAKLEIINVTNSLSAAEISQFGILQVYSDGSFAFTHSTFGEYFLVRYVIDFFNKETTKPEPGDIAPVTFLIRFIVCEGDEDFSCKLFKGFLSSETNLSPILQKIKLKVLSETQMSEDMNTFWFLDFLNLLHANYNNVFKYFSRFFMDETDSEESFDLCKEDDEDEEFLESVDSQMVYFMFSFPLNNNRTIIQAAFSSLIGKDNCSEVFLKALDQLIQKISKEQFLNALFINNNDDVNTLILAFSQFGYETLHTFWSFLRKHFDADEQKNILDMKENSCGNAFYFMSINKNENISLLMKEIIESMELSPEDARDLLMEMGECPTILFGLLNRVPDEIEWIFEHFKSNDASDKKYLLKFLSKRDDDGETIFGIFKGSEELEKFYKLLKTIFDTEKDYKETLKQLEVSSLLTKITESNSDNFSVEYLRSFNWTYTDFVYMLKNWRNIKNYMNTNFKNLLLSENDLNESLLFDLAKIDENLNFLTKIKNMLTKNQLYELLARKNIFNQTALMFAGSNLSEKNFETFLNFFEHNLINETFMQHLLTQDSSGYTVLHYSTWNYDSKMFPFVLKIFEKFFTREKCLDILSNFKQDYLTFLDEQFDLNSAAIISFVESMKKLFANEKLRLQKLLTHRNSFGSTIFIKHSQNENLKHFEELLKFTFNGTNTEFEHFIALLRIKSRFARGLELNYKIHKLRSFYWTFDDFKFLFSDIQNVQEELKSDFKTLMVSRGMKNESLLILLVGYNKSEILIKKFLKVLDENLSSDEIFEFMYSTDEHGKSALMVALNFNVVWEYFGKFSSDQRRKFLMQKTKLKNTALQFATWKKHSSAFTDTTKVYINTFTYHEIQEILLDLSPNAFVFKSAIEDQKIQRNREIINFLKEIFKDEKLKLLNVFCYRRQSFGDSMFGHIDKENENLELYKELLMEVYEGDDFESFYEYLQYKTFMPKYIMLGQIEKIKYPWTYPEFFYFVDYFDEVRSKIDGEGIKKLLGVHQNRMILHNLAKDIPNNNITRKFLNILENNLSKEEILLLFKQSTKNNVNSLMTITWYCNPEKFELYLKFIDENIDENEQKNLLLSENNFMLTALQYSIRNFDLKTFLRTVELYENLLGKDKIKKILLKIQPNFLYFPYQVITGAREKMAVEVVKFMKELFSYEEIRKILTHQTLSKENIFNQEYSSGDRDKFEIFLNLLEETFEGDKESFEKVLKKLKKRH